MIERIHQKLGTAGFAIAIVALIAALSGTALAASGALTGKQKKEVEKIAKKYAGKPGAPGATGPAGPAGVAGPKGDAGAKGDTGSQGNAGTSGTAGKSVALTTEAKGANCTEGGTKVEVEGSAASKKYVCNGTTGFTKTLPPGETETGTWSVSVPPTEQYFEPTTDISFPIPLPKAGEAFFFTAEQVENEAFGTSGCQWSLFDANAVPKANTPGTLCVFTQEAFMPKTVGPLVRPPGDNFNAGYGPAGAYLAFIKEVNTIPSPVNAYGTWAVTSPTS